MVKVCNFKSLPCCRGNKHKIGCVATFPSLFLTLSLTNKINNIYYALDMRYTGRYFQNFHNFGIKTDRIWFVDNVLDSVKTDVNVLSIVF